ncbi:MAG: TonB-dependent receptor [Blastocatellia bacterium]|nr:TonB-dependent receptor [Blastocatellia bacterium]
MIIASPSSLLRSRKTAPAISLCIILLLLSVTVRADDLDNIIFEGIARDNTGALIAGAQVIVRHLGTGVERASVTDEEGRYRIVVTGPGNYKLRVTADGFKQEESAELRLTAGRTVAMNFTLSPSGVSEQITVEASDAPLVDTTRTVVGDTVTRSDLESLPLINRDPLELVFLLGGVAEAPLNVADLADEGRGVFLRGTPEEAGLLSLTGAPATSNNITIDGLDNNDDRSARERITLSPESVAEVQIITNQYAAEYGRASGGRINIRTRGGVNRYRGEAVFFFEDESLNANTYFRNARKVGRLPLHRLREGASFSGPLWPDKYFFFANYERLDVSDFAEISAFVPTEMNPLFPLPLPTRAPVAGSQVGLFEDEISTPETRNLAGVRVDFNFDQSHNATVRFDIARGANKRGFPGGSRLIETLLVGGRDSDSISVSDNFVLSDRAINQARFQFSRLLPRNRTDTDSIGVIIQEPSRVVAGSFTGSASSPGFAREERRTQIQNTLSITIGDHNLKMGGDVQLVRSAFTDLFATGGEYTFETVSDFLSNLPSRFIQRFDTSSRLGNDVLGLFVQDEWRVRPNFTLSLGFRWDNESILDDRDNFSPRISIAWDPFGGKISGSRAGKTVLRAGFGVFYNRALLRTIDDFTLGSSALTVDSDITPEVLSAVQFPGPITDRQLAERFGLLETEFLRRISPDLEIPYTIQSGLGLERQLSKSLVVTADYVFTRGAHLWRESNINAPVLPEGFASFTEYLLSRDFDNRRDASGSRPLTGANADVVRFDLSASTTTTPGAIRVVNGIRLITLGLNAPRSSNVTTALRAVRPLRPDPTLTQVELLEATGNSFYHGGVFSVRYALGRIARLRAAYTLSKFIDEGVTNTASPQDLFDRRAERSLALQDQRHRFTVSGQFEVPRIRLELAPIISFGSSRPFNIGSGVDRNLNDIQNDRPNFIREIGRPEWRRPGSEAADDVKAALELAPIGSNGNLPRNYGRGPGTRTINLRASRTFAVREKITLRPAVDVFNLFNNTVFSFGSEFIDRDDQDFLLPRRSQRPRSVQLSLKVSF